MAQYTKSNIPGKAAAIETDTEETVPESIQQSCINILKDIEDEDTYVRQRMLREAKQLELYWHGFQYIFWDERVQDYRIPTHDIMEQVSSREDTKFIYDYIENIFKAHGLSIIAALSAEIPGVSLSPVDADNPRDLIAAKKAEELGKIIQKSNRAKMLFYHALFTLYTNHFVASYNYYETDEKYGTLDIPEMAEKEIQTPDSYDCPDCGFSTDVNLLQCPDCKAELTKTPGELKKELTQIGTKQVNRGMECINVFGTLNIKIPIYAGDQSACGYLVHYSDQHYAWLRENYKHIPWEKISVQGTDNFERIARMPSIGRLYSDSFLQSLLTLKRVWIRPWMYNTLDEAKAAELHEKYPSGIYFAAINTGGGDLFAEIRQEKLDDHWTIGKGDLSRAAHGDPLGKPLLPIQDLQNMVVNLLTESLEHSVPSTWADPEILDFDTYSKQEVLPGAVYPAKNSIQSGRRLDDYFYTLKTSALPKEGVDFDKIIEGKGQFVVGAFPSIFGGPQTQGSKTLGEYQESRGYALQRLSIPYQLLFFWWADTLHKSVKDYIGNMIADEKHTNKTADGKFTSTTLLVDDFTRGRFSLLIPESATDLPVSFSQKRTTIQGIIQLNSEPLNMFLFSPENRRATLKYLGLEDLSDMEANQTMKTLLDIEELLKSEPIPNPDPNNPDPNKMEVSSLPIEPDIDNPEVALRVIKTFMLGPGQEYKKTVPLGYKNVLLFARDYQLILQEQAMMMQSQQQGAEKENVAEEEV